MDNNIKSCVGIIYGSDRDEYDLWIKSLNKFELNHFQLLYVEDSSKGERSYKNFDIWLFNKWSAENV